MLQIWRCSHHKKPTLKHTIKAWLFCGVKTNLTKNAHKKIKYNIAMQALSVPEGAVLNKVPWGYSMD